MLGFAVVFVLVGAAFGSVGVWLRGWQDEITIVLGLILIVLGLVFAGVVPLAAAGLADPHDPGRRTRRRPADRRAVRDRLDALHRTDATA